MTRRELVLKKIHELSIEVVTDAVTKLTHHVSARMRLNSFFDRTKTGAHSEQFLGMNAIDYYIGESIKKLYDPNGWDWKFEERSLAEQLIRIANKLISDKTKQYLNIQTKSPVRDNRDIADIYNIEAIAVENIEGKEEIYARLYDIAIKVSQDDEDLHYFTLRYFENADYFTIAEEMGIIIDQVHVLRKKLVRRLCNQKDLLL